MAALLVGMSIMAVMMAAALPVWSHATRREKEEELIWRGEQYKRAIMLFQRKYANTFPPSVDILVEQRFLRKKYKDPITDDEFQIIPVGGAVPGMPGMAGAPGAAGVQPGTASPGSAGAAAGGGFGGGAPAASGFGGGAPAGGGFGGVAGGFGGAGGGMGAGGFGQPAGGSSGFAQMTPGTQPSMGIQGVTSKSKDTSIKLYNGMNRYNQWAFVHLAAATQAGAGGATFASPGQGAGGAQQPGPFGAPGGGFGAPGGGFGQPMRPPVPGGPGGFGQPGQSPFGQPGQGGFGQPGGGFGSPAQPSAPAPPGGGIFTPSRPGAPGQPPPPPQF